MTQLHSSVLANAHTLSGPVLVRANDAKRFTVENDGEQVANTRRRCLRARDGPFKANHSATSRTYSNEILTNVPRREVHLRRPQLNVPGKHQAYQDDGLVALVKDPGQHVAQIPRVFAVHLAERKILSGRESTNCKYMT